MRKTEFVKGGQYHIYNRGVDKRTVFTSKEDYQRFYKGLESLNSTLSTARLSLEGLALQKGERLVDIIAYCLNPNHYHLILEQRTDKGVQQFMHKLSTAYTMYFNKKYQRTGSLFQGPFKSVEIDSLSELLRLSAYVNLNYKIHELHPSDSISSWAEYIDNKDGIAKKEIVLNDFKTKEDLVEYSENIVMDIIDDRKKQKEWASILHE